MPELPEVQSVVSKLNILVGKKIKDLPVNHFFSKKLLAQVIGQKVISVNRRAKMINIELSNNKFLVFHLKMTGQLIFVDGKGVAVGGGHPTKPSQYDLKTVSPYTRIAIDFGNGSQIIFHDMRKFGWVKLLSDVELEVLSKKHGPEPLLEDFTIKYLTNVLTKSSRAIKAVLLDQKLIAGLGNIYADEVLYATKVLPGRIAKKLNPNEIKLLYKNIKSILTKAIDKGGTSFNTFRGLEGEVGNYVKHLKVYGRGGQKCLSCGKQLTKTRLAGRGTVYCKNCQK